jgi:hypothetical protein
MQPFTYSVERPQPSSPPSSAGYTDWARAVLPLGKFMRAASQTNALEVAQAMSRACTQRKRQVNVPDCLGLVAGLVTSSAYGSSQSGRFLQRRPVFFSARQSVLRSGSTILPILPRCGPRELLHCIQSLHIRDKTLLHRGKATIPSFYVVKNSYTRVPLRHFVHDTILGFQRSHPVGTIFRDFECISQFYFNHIAIRFHRCRGGSACVYR